MINVSFVVDLSSQSGAGHTVRSSILCDAFNKAGCNVSLVTFGQSVSTQFLYLYKNIDFCESLSFKKPDLLVIDNYNFTNADYRKFKKYAGKVLVLDDLCNRQIDCDFLWDPSLIREGKHYDNIILDTCALLLGGEYHIFSDQHIESALNFRNYTPEILQKIHLYGGHSKVSGLDEIFLGLNNCGHEIQYLTRYGDYGLDIGIKSQIINFSRNPIATYQYCRIGVGSPGNMLWERGSVGLPSYILINNSNQLKICQTLHENDYLFLGSENWPADIKGEIGNINSFFFNTDRLEKMSKKLKEKISLNGKHKIVQHVLEHL